MKKQLTAAGREPTGSAEMQVADAAIVKAQNELNLLKNQGVQTQVNQVVVTDPVRQTPVNFENTTQAPPAYTMPAIGLHTILFERYATKLSSDYDEYINYVARQLRDNPQLSLEVNSYTDNTEKNKISMQVTAAMAGSVRAAFMQRGVHPDRLILKPQGSRKPIASNDTILGQNRNRRVELGFVDE